MTLNIAVTGMDCMGCVRAVEKAVKRVAPDAAVNVDLESGNVTIDAADIPAASFIEAIVKSGFEAVAA